MSQEIGRRERRRALREESVENSERPEAERHHHFAQRHVLEAEAASVEERAREAAEEEQREEWSRRRRERRGERKADETQQIRCAAHRHHVGRLQDRVYKRPILRSRTLIHAFQEVVIRVDRISCAYKTALLCVYALRKSTVYIQQCTRKYSTRKCAKMCRLNQ